MHSIAAAGDRDLALVEAVVVDTTGSLAVVVAVEPSFVAIAIFLEMLMIL